MVFLGLIFLVVLSFSSIYKLSTTNQLLATVVGGFLPMIFRTVVRSPPPDVELGTVSFKSKMDEVIKNFCQYWPMYDLTFEPVVDDDPATFAADVSTPAADSTNPVVETEIVNARRDNGRISTVHALAERNEFTGDFVGDAIMMNIFSQSSNEATVESAVVHSNSGAARKNQLQKQFSSDASKRPAAAATSSVKKTVNINEDDATRALEEVDLLIYLPKYDETWLAEWSEINSYDQQV
jgi:hypothetical protein